ncbi:PLxRFG domain-containing protein [Vibrio cholerae]|uniref:PLxRFG domain-containing protein n=1 Tax=Vibrio cholerae TaxID=666 RepID=UPI0014068431|nr:PLxRFG domain-containing protein [Vibrio cholerae]EGR1081158.1 PLxRFG domain-containing protein [Vibrio cholerae]MBS3658810.1 PLxRFG domain-containing protein [Vibrio cholerae]MDD9693675.1 PLxRFG domain-containing protein [Vibrio cholerae]MDD9702546.1 PLxRFG domain-containing protein [Vibrio cholerae]MVB92128.1 PLxRFG domain-containing protein [Vibrio cholerae]
MQDKKLLGDELSPKSTINASTDMSQSAFLPKGFQFEAPKAPQRNYDVTLGDTAKAVGSGALRSLAGLGELSENFLGVGESFRDLMSSGSDYLQESMTQDGRDALNSRIFEENENGNPTFAEGAADIDVWAMKIADGLGSLAANFAGGGFAGAGAKVALRSTITKSMLKKGMTEKAAQAVADKAISRMAATGAGATGVGTSLGGASMDARDAVMQMDSSWLADNSEYFQQSLLRLADDPQYQGMSATELFDLAKEETASYASLQMSTDPTAVAASVAGAMGDKYLFGALLGKMGKKGMVAGAAKGAITEGGTEFIEGYGQTYARNQVTNEVTGQEIDPTTGALVDGLEGAVIGGALGGPIGAVGGYRAKGQPTENTPAQTNPQNVSDTQEQEIAEQAADEAQAMPNNGDAPAQTAAMNADEPVLNPQGQYDELLQGAQQRQADNGRDAAIRSRFAQSRQALTERGVLPERNAYQETIEMARAVDPTRAAEIEQFLKSEEADQNPELTAQLEREYESLAQKGRDLDIDPTLTQIEHRQNQNRLDMAKREKPHQRIERKQNEYQLDDTVSSRKAAIRAEMEPQLLKEDRNKPELLERMVELEYARRYPQPEKEKATGDQDDGLAQFKSARFDRDTALAAIEAKAQESMNAAQLAAAQRERDSRPASPDENPAWFGVHPESGERTTRAFMRDLANQKGQAQASERQADLDARRERLGQPVSSFVERPNSMKMREQGKKPIRDFAGIAGKTSRMSKRLRKRLSRAKGFDTDAVLAEFQNHEKRLAAYEDAARRRADYEANLPENIERRKNAEALFKEFVSDTEARAFAENEITQTIKRINALVDAAPQGSVLELDGQTRSLPVIKKQMAHSVRNLANQFVGKTAAMMNAAALKKEASTQSVGSLDEPDIIRQAKAVIHEVIDNNGGAKPKLKGVREAYRDKGFTAKALQEALGDKSLADFEREQKERYSDKSKISLRAKQLVYSELELKKNKNGEAYHGNETSNTARSDERPSRQFEVQENDYRRVDTNRQSTGEKSVRQTVPTYEVWSSLPDSGERSVSRDAIERLALDEVDNLANGTATQRIAANIAAIRLMKDLTQSGMPATLEQKKVLAQYVGWGGLASVFDNTNTSKSQQAAHQELKTLLTEEEYNNVRMSTRNAFYTSEAVVKGMWSGVKALGLGNSPMNVVEPSLGSGNFIGWQPSDMRDQSRWFASELDPVTGNIAKLIYPEADVQVKGFQETPFKNGVFSLAIGNPPFGSQSIRDNKNPDISGMAIHNYFIAKSSKLLHESGLLMMVVTNRFLDTLNKNHKQLSQELDFVGAVRLPNTAFKSNAGTEVTTDIVVFRKLKQGETAKNTVWTDVDGEVNGFRVNQWFAQNPQYILGEVAQGKMYRGDESESTVNPVPQHANLEQSISKALASLAQGQDLALTPETKDAIAGEVMLAESDLAIGGMMVNADGKVMRRGDDHPTKGAQVYEVTPDSIWSDDGWLMSRARHFVEQGDKARLQQFADNEFLNKGKIKSDFTGSKLKESAVKAVLAYLTGQQSKNQALSALDDAIDNTRLGPNKFRKLKGILTIRNSALALLRAEKTGAGDIERLRQRLNVQYDEFAQAFATKGKNSKPATLTESLNLLDGDTGIEAGLDSVSESGEVTKSDLFSKRLLFPYKRPESASNVADAVNYSMRERGKVDIEYVSGLLGLGHDEVLAKLTEGEKPYLLMNPETQRYEFIDDYLSGNVKAKYQAAKSAGLDTNVKLLEAVLPEDKTPEQVKPSIRATWIDSDVFERFAEALGYKAKVTVNRHIGAISVMGEAGGSLSALGSQFKHDRATLADLLNSAANGKSLVIYDTNGKERTKNEKATKEVNALANKLASTFVTWAKSDAQIAKQIADNFNERINTHVNRKYNGRLYLQTVGMNPAVDMRKTQLDGALRMIQSKNTLLDHTVGAGKTFTAITGMMERKRLGLSKKPMAVVPNHILGSFHKDILKLYPSAKVLVADDKAFTAKKRKQFFSRIATGDYDVVLMGHSHLRAMPNDIEHFRTVINEKIDELRSTLEEAKAEAKQSGQRGATVKQIEDSISRLQDKIKEKEEALSKNADQIGFTFGDLGVDYLVVDEAHEFKNLTYATRTDRVVGMNDPKGSEKALDLLIKTRSIQGLENGGVTFMTGTPISNSLVEVYTMMYYLGHDTLKELKMSFYDAFAGSFFNTEITLEYTPTGTVKERSVLKGLNNMQQLSTLYRQFADVITQKDMVNIFRQDVEAKNKATGENKATRFPIPNIKGGKRQLNIAPATEAQREYNDYLIARMEAFNQLKTKEERTAYAKIDNPLWVLTDAKKASLDVRLVDPTAQRDPTGKVARAAERIKSIYDQWQDDKGTQLVFSDMGTPAKYAVATVKSDLKNLAETVLGKGKAAAFISSRLEIYEGEMPYSQTLKELVDKVNAQAETGEIDADQYEKLEEQIRELTASTMTADTGFSVYDDLKASLMEKGIPDDEIAFIHDYNTTLKKEALFDRVRRGEVRVLIGSSMKMGAGTNVQNRLVALHHMDAPWRPSDMEQREGRIVRQGNEFYQRAANAGKPEDFEVELIAYTTQGSSDPVMWQILERKAGAIEQFRNGELDQFVENSNSDADSYAEFKAASTGNPIYRLKLESDAKLLDLDSSYTAQASSIGAAKRFVERFDDEKAAIELRLETLRQADITEFDAQAFTELYRDAQADYLAADNEYDAAMAIYSELDAKTRKERGLKKPQKPKRPMIHELDDEYSIELNKAIIQPAIAAIEQSRRWQGEIKLGKQLGLVMDVDYFTHEGTKTPLIDVRLVDGKGKTIDYMARGMQSSSIVQSPKLMNALHLNAIATALNGEQERFERKLQSLQSTLKDSRQIAKMDITALKQELDEAKSRNLWLSVEASMADIKEELRRSETPNKFVDRETLRKVKRSTFDPNSIRPETVEHNGQRYQTVGVRIPYPGWQYDSVMPALDANGNYVHLLLSHNSKVGEAPVLSEVIPQPTQTPKAEYAFLAEAKARHEARQVEEAKREIGSPVDEPSGDSSTIMFSRSTVAGGVKGDAVSETRINRGLVELWAANVMRDNPVISAAGKIVRVVSSESELPDAVKQEIDKDKSHNTIKGVLYGKQVYIVADKHNDQGSIEQVLLHELAGHYGLRKLFGDNIKAELADIRTRLGGKSGVLKLAKKFNVNLAHYATDYDSRMKSGELTPEQVDDLLFDELLAHVSEMPRMAKPLERMWQKIRQYLHKLGFTATAGYTSADLLDLIQAIRNNLIENPDPDGTGPSPKRKSKPNESREDAAEILFSRTAKAQGMSADEALAQKQNALVSKIKQALYGAPVIGQSLDALGRNKYAMLTLRQMGEVSTVIDKPLGKMIDAYQDEINSMVVTQNMLAEEAAKIAEDLSDWAKANPKEADELFAFAHEATLADVDPSEAFQSREEDLKESIAKQERILKEEGGLNSERGSKAWKTLQEERELLKQEPNRRKRHVELRPKFARLNAEQKRRYRQMRDHYRAQSERMNKALEENIVRAVFDAKIRKAMLAELRQRHERAAKGLYFPLSRHGDYWIDFADENGERQFMMFETKGEMELAAEKLRKAGFSLNSGMKAQFNAVQKASLPFVADVLQLVEKANMHTPAKESLSDEIYQMYLRTLPARSMRRNFIHRKGVAGFSQDAVRALADQGFRQSRQQARLDHMDILDNHLDSIQKYVHELPNNVEADRVVEELNKRHEWVRNPSRAGWAQKLTSLGFVWMLGLTPAAALVNLTQNLQVALPILGSRYGMAESSKMMSQATAQYLKAAFTRNRPKGQGVLGSVLTGGEKEAMRRAVAQGVIDVTQAADLAGLAENPNAKYSGTWNKAMNIIGWAFHHAEVFNREVTYIAAYRLAMKKHGDHEKAIADAIKDTWDSHFDYSSINRARFMQSDMAAVALQFKQYSQNMTYYLWANMIKALKGETPEVKAMARTQLLGTLASTFFIGGAGALPLWAITTAIDAAQEIVGDDDEPFDAETELKRMLAEAFGKENAALIWHGTLPSISGRISLNDLWVRSINRDVDASTAYVEYMKQALGPVLGGIGVSWAQGLADISNDQFARGIERIPPKAIKDVLKTARYINEGGVTTKNGDEIVSDLTAFELLGQASGFAIGRANLQYDENNAIKNYETFIVKRRQSLMNAYYTAYRLKDGEVMKAMMVKIRKFNQSQYGKRNPITTESLRLSLKVRARKRSITQNGVQVNPKMNSLVMQYDYF